jgi:histone deacetylase 6
VENDPVLKECCRFVSIHRHDKDFWPKTGDVKEGGSSVVNVPLRGIGYGNSDYYHVFQEIVLPLASSFKPDLILVSAGYDCAQGDQLGRFAVTDFGLLSRMLLAVAPSMFILEGGYDVDGSGDRPHRPLRYGVADTIEGLLAAASGQDVPPLPDSWQHSIRDETKQVVAQVKERLNLI